MTEPDRGTIRKLIESRLTDDEFQNLCLDNFPDVSRQFTEGQTRSHRIRLLVDFASRRNRLAELSDSVSKVNPIRGQLSMPQANGAADDLHELQVDSRPDSQHPRGDFEIGAIVKKTVVELDLVGYSDRARELEEGIGAHIVQEFNDQIQQFVDIGLEAVGLNRSDTVFATTGDGAILLFDDARSVHRFARAFFESCREHNSKRSAESSKRRFRMGAATGDLAVRDRNGEKLFAGTVIANAVRLEAASSPGQFLIDSSTWDLLPKDLRDQYGPEEIIPGKRDETFPGRRCTMDNSEPGIGAACTGSKRESISAVDIWREKLDFYQTEEAVTSDADRRFELKKRIEECQTKISDLSSS